MPSGTGDAPADSRYVRVACQTSGIFRVAELEHAGHFGGMPGCRSNAIGRTTEASQAADTLEEAGARQATGALADYQRTAQRTLGTCIQCGQVLQRGCQSLHGRAGQSQTFDQSTISQQVTLTLGILKLTEQRLPMLPTDAYAQGCASHPSTPRCQASARWMAASGRRSPLSIMLR